MTPLLGGLLLNWRLLLCLILGGPDTGLVALRGALLLLASSLVTFRFILLFEWDSQCVIKSEHVNLY